MTRTLSRLILASCTLAAFGTVGCQYHSGHDTYILVSNNLKLPYWKAVNQGFAKAAAEYGVTARLDGPDTYDPAAELEAFKKAVASKPAGILISVADAAVLRPEINSAIDADIPVITVDSDAPGSARLFFIGTNNAAAGRLGAGRLIEKFKAKANVVVFTIQGEPNLEERLRGYREALADHPQIKIAEVFDTKGDANVAFDQTEKYLARTGADKVDAFVCLESAAGKGIAEVLKRHSGSDRTIIAMDVDPETLNLIRDGSIDSTVAQKPFTMGYVGLKQLDEIHHSLPKPFRHNYAVDSFSRYPLFIDTGTALVQKSNVDIYLQSATDAESK